MLWMNWRFRGMSRVPVGSTLTTIAPAHDFPLSPTPLADSLIDARYRVHGLVGEGATSKVYLCTDEALPESEPVVVKQMSPGQTTSEHLLRRFAVEADALERLEHPSVVRLLRHSVPPRGDAYLVMEALTGETLGELLDRIPVPETDLALLIARQVAVALLAVHRSGLVHRDVKPDNLFLLGPKGAPYGVKIIDFGMAQLPEAASALEPELVVGTAAYMAPEQVMAEPVDPRTDVYAFGIVLFRMFSGHLPFEGAEGTNLLCHQVFSEVPPLSSAVAHVDPRIVGLIRRATRKHPENRTPSVALMLAELESILGFNTLAGPPNPPLRVVPDHYLPVSPQGRRYTSLLVRRYRALCPDAVLSSWLDDSEPEFALVRRRATTPPPAPVGPPVASQPRAELGNVEGGVFVPGP